MNKKISLVSLILILILFTNGCAKEISLVANKGEYFTMYSNDNISVKISNTVKDKENAYSTVLEDLQRINGFSPIHKIEIDIDEKHVIPKIEGSIKCNSSFINTEEFKKELIKRSYDIYDNWISEGLYSKIYDLEKKEVDFIAYYSNNEFSLYGARFFEPFSSKDEIENIKSASVDLVEHLIKKGKKEELLKNQVEIADIKEWAKDKNIDLSYQRSINSLMNRMEVNKLKPNIYLTLNTKEEINGFIIDVLAMDERYKTAKIVEDFILMMDANVKNIKEGIKKDAPNFYNDYSVAIENVPKIHYHFDINADIDFAEMGQGRIVLKNLSAQAHEYSHILIVDSFLNNNIVVNKPIWLDEGMANYLSIAYSESFKSAIEGTLRLILDAKENEDKLNEEEKILADKWYKIFMANNIELNNLTENKNEKIKVSTIATTVMTDLSKLEDSGAFQKGAVFLKGQERIDQKLWPMGKGNYIDYHDNQSFTNSLIHDYGLEKLLYLMVEDFSTLTYEEYFGKSYEELKVDWIEYLKENIKAIELIL
ncbi:hypothetical protein [uncultured Tissierella sp.]|uniref:hypothetical protein n=1 Tax=uncultured Tissierella sp. TaxID=448160 RepID=UPI0028055032|nr:hypothetical protein [uncultured Tissierella sp.]MDU5082785.1 hypothetical protein [Bacillota bacterium]